MDYPWSASRLISHFSSPLRSVLGPFLPRFTKLWYLLKICHGNFHQENIVFHNQFGKVVRYGPNQYSFNDQDAMNTIYGLNGGFAKSSWYEGWAPPQRALFTELDNQAHFRLRQKQQSAYSLSSVVSYEALIDRCTTLLCQRIGKRAGSPQRVDLA